MQGVKDTEGVRVRLRVLENGEKGFKGLGREIREVVISVLQVLIFWGWERFVGFKLSREEEWCVSGTSRQQNY